MTSEAVNLPTGPRFWDAVLPTRKADRMIFAAIVLLALALRGQYIFLPLDDAFSWREASTAMIADNFYQTNWNIFYPEVNWTGPGPSYQGREFQLLTWITALLHAVFGWHDWFGRAVACGFGMLTVVSLHRLVALIWGVVHAHAAALVYAAAPVAVAIDSSFLPDPAMLALVTTGLWIFVRYWLGGPSWQLWLGSSLFTLGALAKLPGLAAGIAVLYLLICLALQGQSRRALVGGAAAGLGLTAVVLYYAWAVHLGNSYPPFHVAGSGYIWDDGGWSKFLRYKFYIEDLGKIARFWFYGWPLIILACVGIWARPPDTDQSATRPLAYVPHAWLAGAVLLYLVAAREISDNPWNLHIFSAPVAIFAGRGLLLAIWAGSRMRFGLVAALRFVLIAAVFTVWTFGPNMDSMKKPYAKDAIAMGGHLAKIIAPGDLVVTVATTVGDPIAIYYARTRGWVFPPGGGDTTWSVFEEQDSDAIAQLEDMKAQGAQWFAVARKAKDHSGRYFTVHHAGVIDYLTDTGALVADTDGYLIFRLGDG